MVTGTCYSSEFETIGVDTKKQHQELEKTILFRGSRQIVEGNGSVGIFFEDIRDARSFQLETTTYKQDWRVLCVRNQEKRQIFGY